MEYKKIITQLDNSIIQPSKFRANDWAEVNDDKCGTFNANSQI